MLSAAFAAWAREGLSGLRSGQQDLTPLAFWAVLTVGLWWGGRYLRRHYGRGDLAEPMQRDRTLAAAIDGVGLVLVPILAVWLIGRLLAATMPPPPLDTLLSELIVRLITVLLVVGLTATALAPHRPAWRVLPFTDGSAQQLSTALRRLLIVGVLVDFVYVALRQGREHDAIISVGSLVIATIVAGLTLPALANRAWEAQRPVGSDAPPMVGGTWWSVLRLLISVAVLASIPIALRATRPSRSTSIPASAATLHVGGARPAGASARRRSARCRRRARLCRPAAGCAGGSACRADFALRGQHIVLLLIDLVLVALLAVAIPAAWSVDVDSDAGAASTSSCRACRSAASGSRSATSAWRS